MMTRGSTCWTCRSSRRYSGGAARHNPLTKLKP
jgi:hypothetical protein